MARPLEFDRPHALESAMKLFWSQGYAATSLNQLLEAMQIGRSSFYAAFTDKRSLFVEALKLFSERTRDMLVAARIMHGPLTAMTDFFHSTLLKVPEQRTLYGCMMVNSVLELADVDQGLSQLAVQELDKIQSLFKAYFTEAILAGDYPAGRTPAELAAFLMLLNQGLRVASRTSLTRLQLQAQIDTGLALLGLPTTLSRTT